jgi:beta-barrel assembly-enhancing protease
MRIFPRAIAAFSAILCLLPAVAWPDTSSEERWETQVGQQRYMEYMQRGEIVPPQSPLYRTLDSIGNTIAAVANRQYFAPFHFVLLNDQTPNALSIPGGDVYVTTALLSFLKNRDELAGVICHEVNHDIHHDSYAVFQATQGGRSPQDPSVIAYERAAEMNADRAGAYLCAKAGFNPWGMVWNFRRYRQVMGVGNNGGADHPSDPQREAALIALFQNHKATFGRFSDDVASATPLALPTQMAQRQYSPYQQYPSRPQYAQQYPQYQQQQYPQYQQQSYPQYQQQSYPQYPQQQYPQYQQQQYPQYPQQQYPQYQQQSYPQYPQQQYPQYPQQQYPPPPPCYPGC